MMVRDGKANLMNRRPEDGDCCGRRKKRVMFLGSVTRHFPLATTTTTRPLVNGQFVCIHGSGYASKESSQWRP
jgi:hypothetical protein